MRKTHGTIRAVHVESVVELLLWARQFHQTATPQCDTIRRFAVGLYQIHQAFDWSGTDSEYESWAAAAIHIMAATESVEIPVESFLHKKVADICFRNAGDKHLLIQISKLQGQLIYATVPQRVGRKSRFNKSIAADCASLLIQNLIGRIPFQKRVEAVYKAMEIMTGDL